VQKPERASPRPLEHLHALRQDQHGGEGLVVLSRYI
jgi:hypothetical protein